LVLIGLLTRYGCVPLLGVICVALYSTKIVTLTNKGFWSTLHEARTDLSMLFGLLFLMIVGAGGWSMDARLTKRERSRE